MAELADGYENDDFTDEALAAREQSKANTQAASGGLPGDDDEHFAIDLTTPEADASVQEGLTFGQSFEERLRAAEAKRTHQQPSEEDLAEGERLLAEQAEKDAVWNRQQVEIALYGVTPDAEILDDLERGAKWASLSDKVRVDSVREGRVSPEDAAELDGLANQALAVEVEVNAEQASARTFDGQVDVLAKLADEFAALGVGADEFTADVLRDGVNPAHLSPKDLDTAVRMAIERDRRERVANAHAQAKLDIVGSSKSVYEGLEVGGKKVVPEYEATIPIAQFEYDSLIEAVNARGAGSTRVIRHQVGGKSAVEAGYQGIQKTAYALLSKAKQSQGR
jgi:hypothetical protein